MHVCMYACVYVRACMNEYMYTQEMHAHTYTHADTHTHAHIHTQMHALTHTPCWQALVKLFGETFCTQHWGLYSSRPGDHVNVSRLVELKPA